MPSLSEIIGQEHIKEHLRKSIKTGKISHAYLISGEALSGKEFIAKAFAQTLMCDNLDENYNPCNECKNCKQALTKNHPDIKYITHEKPNTISVEEIRTQIVGDVAIKPYNEKWKIYIVGDAEKMTPQAQNALLKTLEEPPEYVVILLLTSNSSLMLSTIISRCIPLNLRPVGDADIRRYLMREVKIPDYRSDVCVAFARGNVGKAKMLATSEDFDEIKDESLRILKYIDRMDTSDLILTLKKLTERKMHTDDFLDMMMIYFRDVLIYKATMDVDSLVFKEEIGDIIKKANQSSYDGIENVIEAINKTKTRLKANVNYELAMELLLLTIKEEAN